MFYSAIEPESYEVPDEQKRYKFDLTTTDSNFVYNESKLEQIDLRARALPRKRRWRLPAKADDTDRRINFERQSRRLGIAQI